ncbi:MAG TPA: hypothetical protein PK413_13275, partial [Thermoanaerobaculia bacterium]|nr:hypothetical protein [Thermoanaerobaculia bacterium]
DGKDSARRLGEKFWQPLQREIERQTELAEEPLLLESESLWEGVGPLRRAALCKGLRALFGGAEPSLGAAFLSERLRLQLRARARAWLDEERESRSTEKGGRSWNG